MAQEKSTARLTVEQKLEQARRSSAGGAATYAAQVWRETAEEIAKDYAGLFTAWQRQLTFEIDQAVEAVKKQPVEALICRCGVHVRRDEVRCSVCESLARIG